MQIRALDAAHRDGAIALWEACGLTRPWNDPVADFDRAASGPTSAVLGVFDGDALVGTAMVGDDGHRGWVYYVSVDPQRQGSGIGRALMAAVETWLRDRGVPKLELLVRRSNAAVMAFYDSLGYQHEETEVMSVRLDGWSPTA